MRILIVEDEEDLGIAIKRSLSRDKYVVDWTQDGSQALEYLDNPHVHYSLAIFDWLLPGLSGIELCQHVRQCQCSLPILMLTAKDRIEDKVIGLDAGADDYLVKPFEMAELKARVRALQRRSPLLHAQQLQVGRLLLDYGTATVSVQQKAGAVSCVPLTAKEFQLLEYFMKHPNQIIPREQLMNQVWEIEADPTSNVVPAQMRLLRRKLTDYGLGEIFDTIYGLGYRLNLPHA